MVEIGAERVDESTSQDLKSSFKQRPTDDIYERKPSKARAGSHASLTESKMQARLSMSMHEIELHKRSEDQQELLKNSSKQHVTDRQMMQTLPDENAPAKFLNVSHPPSTSSQV